MTTRRSVSWFLTERGRQFSFAAMTTTGIALASARFMPHTFFLHKYKDFVHYYKDGKPVDLPSEVKQCYENCLNVLNISDIHRKLIAPFSVFGFDLFHAGSTSSRFGVLIGIPVNFTYKSIEDVKNAGIQVNQKDVDWSSETGKKLADSIIWSEDVQKFALCREILMSHNNKIVYESVYPFTCIFFAYTLTQYVNRRLNLHAGPISLRAILYMLTGLFSTGMYFLLKDMTEVYYETTTDKRLCDLGPEYVKSGVELYDKILKRNQALRELMGKEGQSKYTKLGNENHGIRQPRLALVHRKQYFEERLKALNEVVIEKNVEESSS